MSICKSFLPVIDNNSEILILGSMPGIKSLEMKQYYAHKQNRFWRLMGLFCQCENLYELDYDKKLEILLKNRFALWDVINLCKRKSSLDTDIFNEIPNNIENLLQTHKNIKKICLNGNKAYKTFKKNFPTLIDNFQCYKLPSTSPANAKFRLEDLHKEWEKAIYSL